MATKKPVSKKQAAAVAKMMTMKKPGAKKVTSAVDAPSKPTAQANPTPPTNSVLPEEDEDE